MFPPAGSLELHKIGFRCIALDGCTDDCGKDQEGEIGNWLGSLRVTSMH